LEYFTKGRKVRELTLPHPAFWLDLERHLLEAEAEANHYLMCRVKTVPRAGVVRFPDKPMGHHGLHDRWYHRLADAGIVPHGTTSGERMHKARHTAGQRVLDRTGNLRAARNSGFGAETEFDGRARKEIRTAAAIPVEATIVDDADIPVYLRIAEKARHLRELGMRDETIARALQVSDGTVAKAVSSTSASLLGFDRLLVRALRLVREIEDSQVGDRHDKEPWDQPDETATMRLVSSRPLPDR
jgi:hypothetical protein